MNRFLISLFFLSFIAHSMQHSIQQGNVTIPLPSEKNNTQRELCSMVGNKSICSNWAGTKKWTPREIIIPKNEYELANFLQSNQQSFKIVGYGHSWAGLYIPVDNIGQSGVTVVLHHLTGITQWLSKNYCFTMASFDSETITHVEVMTGTSFAALHQQLDEMDLGLSWQSGGIQGLTLGGAISVGFHGSQMSSSSISSVVESLTVYDTNGQPHILDENHHRKLMLAARLGLGVCGVMTRAILPVEPRFHLRRRRWVEYDIFLFLSQHLSILKSNYDRFHYYIHPHSNTVWPMHWENATERDCIHEAKPCRTAQDQWEDELETDYGKDGLPLIMRWDNCCDVSYKAYTHAIDMEVQPLWNGEWFVQLSDKEEAQTVLAILNIFNSTAINNKTDIDLWLHVRYMRGDDIYLHPCYGWEYCTGFELALVAKGMNDSLPSSQDWYRYYHPFEKYFQSKGGRPHWAKDHTIDPEYISRSGVAISSFLEQCQVLNIENKQGVHAELTMEFKRKRKCNRTTTVRTRCN